MSYKITSGCKRKCPVWNYFTCDAVQDKSRCITEENGSVCGSLLAGKNSTNLITHLRTCHKSAYEEFAKQQEHSSAAKKEQKAKQGGSTSIGSKHVTSGKYLINFLKGAKQFVWRDDSKEKLLRDEALCMMTVMSGVPARLVEHTAFRDFCNILDPKYAVPGQWCIVLYLNQWNLYF